jgi:hypothetical protein
MRSAAHNRVPGRELASKLGRVAGRGMRLPQTCAPRCPRIAAVDAKAQVCQLRRIQANGPTALVPARI